MGLASVAGKFLILWQILETANSSGFLFTAPRTFLSGRNEKVCITFKSQTNSVDEVKVKILKQKEDFEIASAVEKITEIDRDGKCFEISIPRTKIKNGRLQLTMHLKTDGDFNINYVEQISIQPNPDVSFIQTDKSVYNGNQLLRFRIFTLKSDLTPATEPVDRIWIENPNGIHLAQWLNVSDHQGIVSKTFQLSREPVPGKWFIKMKSVHGEIVSQSFLVENYLLPKFSVVIRSPEYIITTGNVTVCAKYLFGEPIHGVVVLEYFVKCSFSYYCQESGSSVTKSLRLDKEGCVVHEISLKNLSNFAQTLVVNASVVEDGTRAKAKALSRIEIRNPESQDLPEFSSGTKRRKFKPGLPFRGEIILNSRSKTEEKLVVCLESSETKSCRELSAWGKKTEFLLLPLRITNELDFKASIEVRNLKETKKNQATKLNLIPWYSPSGSYIQLENLSEEPLKCNQNGKFNVLYAISNSSVRFHYLVKSRGAILTRGFLDEFAARAKPFEYGEETKPINSGDLERVKRFEFDLAVSSAMSPRAQLLVYFIRDDEEVVADTLVLDVEKCLPKRVTTKWGKNVTLPGSDADLLIQTSSNSLCALAVTDKSVQLLSHSNNVNPEKVLKEFEKFEMHSLHGNPNNHCKEDEKGHVLYALKKDMPLNAVRFANLFSCWLLNGLSKVTNVLSPAGLIKNVDYRGRPKETKGV